MRNNRSQADNPNIVKRLTVFLMSLFTAVALCVTGVVLSAVKPASVDAVTPGDVDSSGNYTNTTETDFVNKLVAGNTITYTTNKIFTARLGPGTYRFDLYGAQGGSYSNGNGGKGGHTQATYSITSTTTIYICVGGTTSNTTGGYNGGGTGRGQGKGGGGATHIGLQNALLKNTSTANVLAVAGGGGGAQSRAGGYGGGGNNAGGTGTKGYGNPGKGGAIWSTSNGGGAGGTGNSVNGSKGSFGQGGAAGTGSDGYGAGAGGGGYWGGGGGSGDYSVVDDSGGGGGSGYIKSGLTVGSCQNGSWTGGGKAVITAVTVNNNPTSKNAVISGGTRGSGKTVNIAASAVASDPNSHTVYFSAGNTSNLDTLPGNNAGLYINSTTLATNYLDWIWVNNTTLRITNIKKLPRAGLDGATVTGTTGRLPLYVWVRDSYGTTGTMRGYAKVKFYLDVTLAAPQFRQNVTLNVSDSNEYNDVYVGVSKINTNPQNASVTNIYNPSGAGRNTAMIAKPLRLSSNLNDGTVSVNIKASELVTGVVTAYDKAVIVIPNTSTVVQSNANRVLAIDELDGRKTGKNVTMYNTANAAVANAFTEITVRGVKTQATYIVLPIQVYVVENSSARGANYQINGTSAISIELVFKVDNTRPKIANNASPGLVSLTPMSSQRITLSQFFSDVDNNAISSSTHTINRVVVPQNEYIQLGKYGQVVSTLNGSASYYNLVTSSALPSKADIRAARDSGQLPNNPTGFNSNFIATTPTADAYVQYAVSGDSITFTGLRATYSRYSASRTNAKAVNSGGNGTGTSLDNISDITTANIVNGAGRNLGHFYVLINVTDKNDASDTGIWLPIALQVNNIAPTETSEERGQTGASYRPTAEGNVGQSFFFSPMGITVNRETKPIGTYKGNDGKLIATPSLLQPLGSDADNYNTISMVGSDGKINELLTATTSAKDVQNSVANNGSGAQGKYFTVEPLDIFINASYFGGRVKTTGLDTATEAGYVKISGYKITLNNFTYNRYMNATVTLRDVSGATKNVYISIKVNNSAPKAADNVVVLDYDSNGRKVSSVYTAGDVPTITYNMPAGSTAVITPYDLLTDDDMTRNGVTYPDRGFTLNGLNGRLDGGTLTDGGASGMAVTNLAIAADRVYDYTSSEYKTQLIRTLGQLDAKQTFGNSFTATNTFVTPEAKTLGVDRLYFERTNDSTNLDAYNFDPDNASFATPTVVNGDYASLFSGNRVVVDGKSYKIDFFVIRANTRTPAGTAYEATFTVRDRTGAGSASYPGLKQIRVCVNVVNSNPSVKDENRVHTLSTENTSLNPKQIIFTANGNGETSTGILVDNEGDTPMFAVGRAYTVVDVAGNTADEAGNPYLGSYITVAITSDTMTVTAVNSTQKMPYLRIKFCATDGRSSAEYSDLELRVFVSNAPITANETELGFGVEKIADRDEHVWTIDSVNRADMTSARYFVSNAAAANELSARSVSDRQIKYMYSDTDALQNAVLSPKSDISASGAYKNAPSSSETDAVDYETRLKSAVPIIGIRNISQYPSNAVGVLLDFAGPSDSVAAMYNALGGDESYIANDYDLLYFVDGEMYEAKKLIRADDDTVVNNREKFFDSRGRWIVTDWAIRINPTKAFLVNTYLNVQTLVRDETRFGGDSAGLNTGYNESGSQIAINGYEYLTYYLFVKDTSIVAYDYYDRFNGYYTVADGSDLNRNYIPAYDASLDNQTYDYTNLDPSITVPGSLYYHAGNREVAEFDTAPGAGSGYELVKNREQGAPTQYVGRLAGADYTAAIGNDPNSPYLEGAFRYSHTINVSSATSEITYIPMSYFALPSDLTDGMTETGEVKYFTDSYVAYDIRNPYDRNNLGVVSSAITLSDGVHTWSGNSGEYALNRNPYVEFGTFNTGIETDKIGVSNSPYLNKAVSITTYTTSESGPVAIQNTVGGNQVTYFSADNNKQMLIGNGHAMILPNNVNSLQEHQFGLTLKKSSARAAGTNLTMTVAVSKCNGTPTNTSVVYANDADKAKFTAVVSYKLEIGNAPVTLDVNSVTADATAGYYTDVQITNGSSQSYEIELKKKGEDSAVAANKQTIFYNDADLHDQAFFYPDSAKRFDTWSAGADAYERVKQTDANGFVNCASSVPVAQASLRNYFGNKTNADIAQLNGEFTPNSGKYGTKTNQNDIIEGFSKYFSVSFANGNQSLIIRPLAKTLINAEAIGSGASMEQIRQFYAARGLVPRIEGAKVVGAYYPLKVLIYDSCGDGFGAGSYVALEVRVEVLDALPTFSGALVNDGTAVNGVQNKKLDISLAVGGTFSLNLKEYIVDPDMISTSADSLIWKSTYDTLLAKPNKTDDDNFVLETSDYLVSPFVTDIGSGAYNNFTPYGDRTTAADITMSIYHEDTNWTDSTRPAPSSNSVVFTLNRRALGTSSYTFKLHFTDNVHYASSGRYDFSVVPTLTVNVRVINQAPTVRSENLANSIKMRAGDTFTVFTTPYEKFFDADNPASMSSNSVVNFDRTANKNLANKTSGSYEYAKYTSEYLQTHGLRDYNDEIPDNQHLGFAAIANDDTPWTMRLSYNFATNTDADCFTIERQDRLAPENNMGGNAVPLTLTVRAVGVCSNVPLTFTVNDYEGGTATYTIYITVESSRPVAVTPETHESNEYTLNTGLSFTKANGVVVTGEYNMYMFAASDDTQVDAARSVILRDNTRVNAYGKIKINIGSSTVNGVKVGGVAYDPDSNDNDAIGLYYSSENVPIFSINGIPMTYNSATRSYSNERYVITPSSDMRSFTVTCLSYDFNRDWDDLQFYVKDAGNNTFDNALRITIHISTLYSSMTNKHMTTDKINNAGSITGVDEVYVKSYDRFSGKVPSENDEDMGKLSRYQFMNYYGVGTGDLVSVDQVEGKSGAFIADSDVAATTEGMAAYGFKLYALMDEKADESGYEALTIDKLNSSGMFTVDRANGYFYSESVPDKYLIGGISHDGTSISARDNGLLTYLQDYVIISVGADGLSLDFRPISTNRNDKILLYVQVDKNPSMTRLVAPRDSVLTAGSLFYLSVENSAPMANTDEETLSFAGAVGSSATFKVYDHLDELGSMFTDSDTFDNVTVEGSGAYNDRQYREAFAEATRLGIDWDESKGKTRAIDISVDKARNEVTVTINRRIDMRDEDGKYLSAVEVPIVFEGTDMSGAAAAVTLRVTVLNSDIDVNGAAIGSFRDAETGYGYSLSRDTADGRDYTLHAYVSRDLRPLTFNVRDIFSDPDFTTALSDTDSFRLVAVAGGNYDKYVTDDVHKVMYESDEKSFELASVTPTFYNNDGYRFSGFTITASSYARDHSATAYMRVLDRCGDVNADDASSGITLKIVVEIINSAPSVLDGKDNTLMTIVGASVKTEDESDELETITLDIADYVTDINTTDTPDQKGNTETYLRIRFVAVDTPTNFFATKRGAPEIDDLATYKVSDDDDRILTITPKKGYFGEQVITVTVYDGSENNNSSLGASFKIRLSLVYDFKEVDSLKQVSSVRGIPVDLTTDMLVERKPDMAGTQVKDEGEDENVPAALADADTGNYFNPAEGYVITSISAVSSSVTEYVSISQAEDGTWRLTPLRVTPGVMLAVEFSMPGSDKPYSTLQFMLTIDNNPAPVLKDAFRTDEGYVFNRYDTSGNRDTIVLNQDGTANISPKQLFTDNIGDVVSFVSAKSKSSSLVSVNVVAEDNLALTFFARGSTEITVVVKDLTGDSATYTFIVVNTDLDEPTLWQKVMISYETNTVIWLSVAAAILLLIIILIIILIAMRRRKKKQQELEEMLISEMELEEQMMRLNAAASATKYQSYGYLPPTMPVQNDPTLMLGSAPQPQTNPTPTLNLNAGQSSQNGNDQQ